MAGSVFYVMFPLTASPKSLSEPLVLSKVHSQFFFPDGLWAVRDGCQLLAGKEVRECQFLIFIISHNCSRV